MRLKRACNAPCDLLVKAGTQPTGPTLKEAAGGVGRSPYWERWRDGAQLGQPVCSFSLLFTLK